ncbi:MAG: hypothetical protein ACOY0T_09460 [Myxococcota bacterium]
MNARANGGLTPPTHKELLANFRKNVLSALGLNGNDESKFLDHAVSSACVELEVIASTLTSPTEIDAEQCGLAVRSVVERLQLARELQGGMWDPERPEETIILKGGKP